MLVDDNFGNKIKEARERAGLTAAELARDVGISQSYLSLVEQGKRTKINKGTVYLMKHILKINEFELLENTGLRENITILNNMLLDANSLKVVTIDTITPIINMVFHIINYKEYNDDDYDFEELYYKELAKNEKINDKNE